MTDFFKHGNKVYSENLNDGILVGNSFDWTVNISLPGDTGGVFPNTTTVVKAKVADVYATPNSNLSIGETITNNAGSSQVYRLTVYPSFNRYGGFTSVSLVGDGDVIITEVGASSPIRNNLDYSDLGDVVELKQLKEYDLVVTIPSGGVVTGLGFGFKSSTASVNASISQANVSGLVDDLSRLDDVPQEISNLNTEVWGSNTQTGDSRIYLLEHITRALRGSVNSLSDIITNLIKVQYVVLDFGSISSGVTGTQTATVTACPDGYSTMIVPKFTSWCVVNVSSVSGTTLSVSVLNNSSGNHTCSAGVYVIYYPSSWDL